MNLENTWGTDARPRPATKREHIAIRRWWRWHHKTNLSNVQIWVTPGGETPSYRAGYHYIERKDGSERIIDHPGAYRRAGGGYARYAGAICRVGAVWLIMHGIGR